MIHSPSRGGTETFIECPRKYQYSLRWEPPNRWRPELWMGTEVNHALARHFGGSDVEPHLWENPWLQDTPAYTHEAAEALVHKVVTATLKSSLDITRGARVLSVERPLGPEGCHPDLVLVWPDDTLSVVDWKFTYSCPPEYVARRLQEYESVKSWQLWHYAWRVSQQWGMHARQWTVVLMIATPQVRIRRVEVEVPEGFLARWGAAAFHVWARMDAGDDYPRFDACLKYGGCPYYGGCWTLGADESKFETLYTRRQAE